MFKNVKKIN